MSVSEERGSPAPSIPLPKQNVIPPPFEGQLNKFTNVVKGWQYRDAIQFKKTILVQKTHLFFRWKSGGKQLFTSLCESRSLIYIPRQLDRWFVLDTEAGTLAYHLMDERHLKSRGTQHLSGSVVIPSDEDSVTFSVSFASGDVYKVHT